MTDTETVSVLDSPVMPSEDSAVATDVIEPIKHIVKLTKAAGRALDDNKSELQLNAIMSAGRTDITTRYGWTIDFAEENRYRRFHQRGNGMAGYLYTVAVAVECRPSRLRKTFGQEFDNIVARMHDKAIQPANRWQVSEIDGVAYVPKSVEKITVDGAEEIGYVPLELPSYEEWSAGFDHLYGLEDYTDIIYETLKTAIDTAWQNRVNIMLAGPPACGKSDICKTIKRILGEEAVLEFDGTSTTMAGAQQNLAEREEMPRVLLVEEIEKAPEASLQWLLSVLDLRGEVRKTTARGNILKEVHMVGICTVNNVELFERMAAGALASRFSMPLYFVRPGRDILERILRRELKNIRGVDEATSEKWIAPTLDYAESIDLSDPRKIIAICLTGRDKLLTGEYQNMLRRTADRRVTPKNVAATMPTRSQEAEYAF